MGHLEGRTPMRIDYILHDIHYETRKHKIPAPLMLGPLMVVGDGLLNENHKELTNQAFKLLIEAGWELHHSYDIETWECCE